jgi:hypothetical protein
VAKRKQFLCLSLWLGLGTAAHGATLLEAVQRRDESAIRALLAQGTDVDARDVDGATALL